MLKKGNRKNNICDKVFNNECVYISSWSWNTFFFSFRFTDILNCKIK